MNSIVKNPQVKLKQTAGSTVFPAESRLCPEKAYSPPFIYDINKKNARQGRIMIMTDTEEVRARNNGESQTRMSRWWNH